MDEDAESYDLLDYYWNESVKWQGYAEELEKSNEKIKGELYSLKLGGKK